MSIRAFGFAICASFLVSSCTSRAPDELPGGPSGLNASKLVSPLSSSQTFHFVRGAQHFKVPAGVTQLSVTAAGARGGGSTTGYGYAGARGAKLTAMITVKPGQDLTIYVGSRGIIGGNLQSGGGGFNGGGGAIRDGYGGGGSSDVRTGSAGLHDRIVVAGGGGGTGETFHFMNGSSGYYWCYGGAGGKGGGPGGGSGGFGGCGGGGGGAGGSDQSAGSGGARGPKGPGSEGGSGNCYGRAGKKGHFLFGGDGASGCSGSGGGGGGGYFGGGGGGSGGCCNEYGGGGAGGAGGGGASYVEASATKVNYIAGGGPNGDGVITLMWSAPLRERR